MRFIVVALLMLLSVPCFASYQDGLAAEQRGDYTQAIRYYLPLAQAGDVNAQLNLGYIYATVQHRYAQSFYWYQKASASQNPRAWNSLGLHYLHGWGTRQNLSKAIAYFRQSAQVGDVFGMENLGSALLMMDAKPKQQREGVRWLAKAARAGDKLAQYNLGMLYADGQIVKKDIAKSIAYYEQAAKQQDRQAMMALAALYRHGDQPQLKPNAKLADQWLARANQLAQ